MIKLTEDISKLTNISKQVLDKLTNLSISCICDAVETDIINGEDILEVDIGIGTLKIKHSDNEIRYKFCPSAKFEEQLMKTILEDANPLKATIEDTLCKRITSVYKELL